MPISRFLDCQFNRFLFDKTTQLYSDDHLKRTNEQATTYLFIWNLFFAGIVYFLSPFLIEGFFCRCPTRCVLDKNPSLISFHQSMEVGIPIYFHYLLSVFPLILYPLCFIRYKCFIWILIFFLFPFWFIRFLLGFFFWFLVLQFSASSLMWFSKSVYFNKNFYSSDGTVFPALNLLR